MAAKAPWIIGGMDYHEANRKRTGQPVIHAAKVQFAAGGSSGLYSLSTHSNVELYDFE